MISAKDELAHAVSDLDEQQTEEVILALHLLFAEEIRQKMLDLLRELAPDFFGS